MSSVKSLEELVQWYDNFEEATADARAKSERDMDYYHGIQWTAEEEAILKKRGQPPITYNRIAPKVDFVLGYERRSRTDPKAWPRTPVHEGAADAATDSLRYVCDATQWPQQRSTAYEDMLVPGTGAAEVLVRQTANNDVEIRIEQIPWDRLFWDPRSRFVDFRDSKYVGQVIWMDLEDAMDLWPNKKDVLEHAVASTSSMSDTHDDRPKFSVWGETAKSRSRIKIAQIYYRCGHYLQNPPWYVATYTKSGFLDEPQLSPYVDEHGTPECPLYLNSAKIDRDNNRYGIVRNMISVQDEVNKRRSKALHLLNTRQLVMDEGAVEDVRQARQELAKPDGLIIKRPNSYLEILPTGDLAAGQFQLLQEAKAELDSVGVNAALSGKDPRAQSGVAMQTRQEGGLIELEPVFDGMKAWQLRVYRGVWNRIKQFWTAEKWVRVTDSEDNLKYVGLNRPVTAGEMMKQRGMQPPDLSAMHPHEAQQIQAMLSQVVHVENEVANLDVDIILDESPDIVTLQSQQFEQLAQMASSGVPIPPDVLIEASSLRNKKRLLDRMKGGGASPEEQQAAAQQQQQTQALQMQGIELELAQKQASVEKTQAETHATVVRAQNDLMNIVGGKQKNVAS